jgi:hypothetical protein
VRLGIEECDRLDACQFKPLAAANILASDLIFAQDHVGLRFGEAGAVTFVGARGQAVFLAPDQPVQLILRLLAAMGASQGMGPLLWFLTVKISLFHDLPSNVNFQYGTAAALTANLPAAFSTIF